MAVRLRKSSKDVRQDIHLPSIITNDRYRDESDYCQICRLRGKKRLAEHYCSTCTMPMCPQCKDTHANTRVTSDHFIVPKKEQDVNHATCPVHRFANVQYFCDSCSQLVCVNCTMIEHRKHEIVEIPEKVDRCRQQLESAVAEMDLKVSEFDRDLKRISEIEGTIEENREAVKSEINAKVVTLIQSLKKQQEDLLKQIDRYLDDKTVKLAHQKEVLTRSYNEYANARMSADIKNRTDLDNETFIQNAIQVQRHVDNLQEPQDLEDVNFKYMSFIMTNDGRFGYMDEDIGGPVQSVSRLDIKPKLHTKGVPSKVPFNKSTKGMKKSVKVDEERFSEPDHDVQPPSSSRSTSSLNKLPRSEPAISRSQGKVTAKALLPLRSTSQQSYTVGKYNHQEDDFENSPSLRIVNRFKTHNYVQNPSGIGVLPNGKYVIADAANYGILMCDKSGRWQQRMFTDEVAFPTGVAVNREGNIAVATHKYVKIFRTDGIKVKQFQVASSTTGALAIDDYGHYVLLDLSNKQLVVYDDDGLQLRTINPPDIQGIKPDSYNLGVGGDHIALSYNIPDTCSLVKLYNYRGDLLKTCDLPDGCKGIQMDRFGNMIVGAGDLFYVPAKGNDIMPLRAKDKKGKWFRLTTRCVAFTPQGLICTLHVNKLNQRSELMLLHLGG